jgi:hypothetical protein
MHALADRLQTLRAEPFVRSEADATIDGILAARQRSRPWKSLARDAACAGVRFLSAGPGHRLALGSGPLLFEPSAGPGRPWACGTPLSQRLAAADLPDGRPVVLGGPARGHACPAAVAAVAQWAERQGLPAPDGTRLDADWWIAPGAARRRGPLVAVFPLKAPERIQFMRLWDA